MHPAKRSARIRSHSSRCYRGGAVTRVVFVFSVLASEWIWKGFSRRFVISPGRRSRLPSVLQRATANLAADLEQESFLDSPMGIVREQFIDLHACRFREGRRVRLPPLETDVVPVKPHQVKRDIEQMEYLLTNNVLNADLAELVAETVIPDYQRVLEHVTNLQYEGPYFTLRYDRKFDSFFRLYLKALHLNPGEAVPEAINQLDFEALQDEYFQKEHRALVVDNFFTPEALDAVRGLLLESTFWQDAKHGYVGTYLHTAFASPLTAQIDRELRSKFSRVLEGLELQNAWSFMFDGSLGGVDVHADDSQVQINFFLTPSEANLWSDDPRNPGGGLIVYGIGPSEDWNFREYNCETEKPWIEERLASTGHWNVTIPYLQNRAIMFDSTYLHRTDDFKFKKGYKNRRINMTFLYGKRAKLAFAPTVKSESA